MSEHPLWNDQPIPDWVKDRGNCTTVLGFRALANIVERDVQRANELPAQLRGRHTFRFERNGQDLQPVFRVIRCTEGLPETHWSSVVFVQKQTCIEITIPDRASVQVIPSWDANNHQCRWSIDKINKALWQVSQEVLGDFFFTQ